MNKLIKLSDTQYIVIKNSVITTLNYKERFFDSNTKVVGVYYFGLIEPCWRKITHSTEPLEFEYDRGVKEEFFDTIRPLSLSEVEEFILDYDINKRAINFSNLNKSKFDNWYGLFHGYVESFKAYHELKKDKLFTVEDIENAIDLARMDNCILSKNQIIKSLLPKTEWDIEFDELGKIKLI